MRPRLRCGFAAVDGDDLTHDESGLVGGEELDDVGDLVDVAEASIWDAGGQGGSLARPPPPAKLSRPAVATGPGAPR